MEKLEKLAAYIQSADSLKGQYLRNTRDQTIWKVTAVGKQGVTCYQVEGYGLEPFGEENTMTWGLVHAMYAVMVHAGEIDAKETH